MKMKKKYKVILVLLLVVILILSGLALYRFFNSPEEEKPPITNITKVTNAIEGYNYTLEDRDTELFGELFKTLKENLESDTPNEETYAKTLAQIFIVDLFTIDNKISKYDIGGLEYLYEGARESFRSKILDSIYKTVEDDSYKTRKQNLPIVKTVEVLNVENTTYKIGDTKYNAYQINLSWTYEENLGYDTKASIVLIKEENKLSIVSYKPIK